jgi:endoglucanase
MPTLREQGRPSVLSNRRVVELLLLILFGGWEPAHAMPAFPLHTQGAFIVDSEGHRVRLNGFSWYGADSTDYVVGGLQAQRLSTLVREIKGLGFNIVRLPWSNELYEHNPVVGKYALTANPDMEGERALEVMDEVVAALREAGIMVILDNHTSDAEWCCKNDGNNLWYNDRYPESSWIRDWKGMAKRYANNPMVIGADVRNEPRISATWGGNSATDWHAAAERAGNAVLSANPSMLIFVEGIDYALDLSRVTALPVRLKKANRVVYEAHDYSFDHHGLTDYTSYVKDITPKWGYLATGPNPTPLWIGEFGTCNTAKTCITSTLPSDNGFWFNFLAMYVKQQHLDWAYWSINGTEATGAGRSYGKAESYGVLDSAWSGPSSSELTQRLKSLMSNVKRSQRPATDRGSKPRKRWIDLARLREALFFDKATSPCLP